jgi:hypothetical protein
MRVVQHYARTTNTRISNLVCEHIQIGKRDVGRPRKRRTDQTVVVVDDDDDYDDTA